jgi:hypothetical protein
MLINPPPHPRLVADHDQPEPGRGETGEARHHARQKLHRRRIPQVPRIVDHGSVPIEEHHPVQR